MRGTLSLFVAVASLAAVSLRAADISYGSPRELKNVRTMYVWQTDPADMKSMIITELRNTVPNLVIAEQDDGADAVFVVKRRSSESKSDPQSFVTTAMVLRALGPERSHILMEPVSTETDLQAALHEVIQAFVVELQRANGETYGKAPPAWGKKAGPRFRSTAGLRAGMSKKQVRAAVGSPTRIDGKGARTQIWWYQTTDGATRVVFGGDAVLKVQFIAKD